MQGGALDWRFYAGAGAVLGVAHVALGGVSAPPPAAEAWLMAAFLVVVGAACTWNGARCGALHCKLSGPAYVVLAVVVALAALGVVGVRTSFLWFVVVGVFLGAQVAERVVESRASRAEA